MSETKQNNETFDDRGVSGFGRCRISEPANTRRGRTRSFSKRALQGKIKIFNKTCPHCFHHKIKRNESTMSPFFDKEYCCACKKEI